VGPPPPQAGREPERPILHHRREAVIDPKPNQMDRATAKPNLVRTAADNVELTG
jgi:hypothetical protein